MSSISYSAVVERSDKARDLHRQLKRAVRGLSRKQKREALKRAAIAPLGNAALRQELRNVEVGIPAVAEALGVGR